MITLIPEEGTADYISTLSDMGVVVLIGHSNVNLKEKAKAISCGLWSFIHLFNAMPILINRNRGIVMAAINLQC